MEADKIQITETWMKSIHLINGKGNLCTNWEKYGIFFVSWNKMFIHINLET